ncbi:hypothetical protein [Actinoplanes sp. NPDC051851]|uniref:hypothetical protein n=1 Tax=Actinoplanes sp. NPDC051851 TaxID=3154753 RepID=UPI0034220FFF
MPFIREIRRTITTHLAERREHRRLADELAAFRTAAERTELDLIVGRHTAEETREIEAILSRQDADRRYHSTVHSAF